MALSRSLLMVDTDMDKESGFVVLQVGAALTSSPRYRARSLCRQNRGLHGG